MNLFFKNRYLILTILCMWNSIMSFPVHAEQVDIPLVGSRVRVDASQLGEGWHVGMLNHLRVVYPCYLILIFGPNNTITFTLTPDDITQIQVSSIYNKGFVGNYDPTQPSYSDEEWIDVPLDALQVAEKECREKTAATQETASVHIDDIFYFRDGGTVGVKLTDQNGEKVSFCFDRRLGTYTPKRIYFGATHPSGGAELVERESVLEKRILFLLEKGFDTEMNQEQRVLLLKNESAADLSQEEAKFWWLLKRVEQYKNNESEK